MNQKEFQKVISAIRNDIKNETGKNVKYPKAMMTGQQIEKRTATVNCGGEWTTPEKSRELAERVLFDARFIKLLKDGISARTEKNSFGTYQVRINW